MDNNTRLKAVKAMAKNVASTDKSTPHLQAVFYEPLTGRFVATNGRIMFCFYDELFKDKSTDELKEALPGSNIVDTGSQSPVTGKLIYFKDVPKDLDPTYPNYRMLIPAYERLEPWYETQAWFNPDLESKLLKCANILEPDSITSITSRAFRGANQCAAHVFAGCCWIALIMPTMHHYYSEQILKTQIDNFRK